MNELLATYKPLFPGGIIVNPDHTTIIYDDGVDHPARNPVKDKWVEMLAAKEDELAEGKYWVAYWESQVFVNSNNEKFMTNLSSSRKNVESLEYQVRVLNNLIKGADPVQGAKDFKTETRMAKKNAKKGE